MDLLERDEQRDAIAAAIDGAARGEASSLLIEAAAGMGKTRLLGVGRVLALQADLLVLAARGSPLECDFPFGVAHQLFDPVVRRSSPRERRALFADAAALARPLFASHGRAGPSPRGRDADPSVALISGLYWLLANLCEREPCALLVDDAHWSDSPSRRFLAFALARLAELPVVVLIAIRPPERAGEEAAPLGELDAALTTRLALEPLSTHAVARMVAGALGDDGAPEFVAACREVTAGNPFFTSELLAELARERVAPAASAVGHVRGLAPSTVSQAVLARIAGVSQDAAALARALAVLGGGELRHAAALAGMEHHAAVETAAALTRVGVLADQPSLQFVHPIVRAAIVGDLTGVERADGHARAARVLSQAGEVDERVAVHLLECEPIGEPWARVALVQTARRAQERGASDIAARYLRRALAEPNGEGRGELLHELGRAEFRVGDLTSVEHLQQALEVAQTPAERAGVTRELALALATTTAGLSAAIEMLEAEASSLAAAEPALALELTAELSGIALLDHPGAGGEALRRLTHYRTLTGRSPAERVLLANIAQWLAMTGSSAAQVGRLIERALGDGESSGDATSEAPALNFAVYILLRCDRFSDADRLLDQAVKDAYRRGSLLGLCWAGLWRAASAYYQGDLLDAEAEARRAVEGASPGYPGLRLGVTGWLVDALTEQGKLEEALTALERSGLGEDVPERLGPQVLLSSRGRLRLAQGHTREGVADLLECARRAQRIGAGYTAGYTAGAPTYRTFLAAGLAALGEHDHARAVALEEVDLARAWGGSRRGVGMALNALGAVEGDAGEASLRESVSALEPTRAKLEHARALLDLGRVLRRTRQPAKAREPLRRAYELAARCHAAPIASSARDELAATGVRRLRRVMLSGVEALTPNERRIAALAAEGLTNRQIAQMLFLSIKTVEMHLHNAYGKLDIKTRRELPEALKSPPAAMSAGAA